MNIRYCLSAAVAFALSGALFAGRGPGFSMFAFNAAVPSCESTAVFSPYSFEMDCVVISEGFDSIRKSRYVEATGALVGYDSVYKPIVRRYESAGTNGFTFISARAYLVTSLRLVTTDYRVLIQSEYGVHTCPLQPSAEGAECFLRASMDGEMEDFRVPDKAKLSQGVSYCDLVSFRCAWAESFPVSGTSRRGFTDAKGVRSEVEMMSAQRIADVWTCDRYSMLRLPMADDTFFFAVLPNPGIPMSVARADFAAAKLNERLVVFKAVGDPSVYRGPVNVVIPRLELDSTVELAPAFAAASLPLGGFKELDISDGASFNTVFQRTRFVLDERGCGDPTEVPSAFHGATGTSSRGFVCDRPFFFFIYHEPTRTVPAAGVFAG